MNILLQQISGSLTTAINAKIESLLKLAPYILGAMSVFLFGWILAEIVYMLIMSLSKKINLEQWCQKAGLTQFLKRVGAKYTATEVIANTAKGYFIFLFFVEATKIAQLTQIADFLSRVISYIPAIIIAIFIMMVGFSIGDTLQAVISTSLSFAQARTSHILGLAAKYTIVAFAVLAALSQLEIAEVLIQILFVGLVATITISLGLAFGLGGKEVIREILEEMKKGKFKPLKKA